MLYPKASASSPEGPGLPIWPTVRRWTRASSSAVQGQLGNSGVRQLSWANAVRVSQSSEVKGSLDSLGQLPPLCQAGVALDGTACTAARVTCSGLHKPAGRCAGFLASCWRCWGTWDEQGRLGIFMRGPFLLQFLFQATEPDMISRMLTAAHQQSPCTKGGRACHSGQGLPQKRIAANGIRA